MVETREVFHRINIKRKEYFNELLDVYDLTFMELEILAFLDGEPDSNTFTQIMKAKDYAKSHVSTAINHLANCGYLEKIGASTNKKVYRLHLLEKSAPVLQGYYLCVQAFQTQAFAGITDADLQLFNQVIHQINQNLR
ncbi:winged helix DNA-binding protein [Bengtsoniella intestinalis]|uniref:MarR family winged helix-turn-helix transcriptional regulator n=1 Tax=Bengtsoniella intestinalis TaxID=3073143 RepID=UPI00391F3680